jgi:hypothetical protein
MSQNNNNINRNGDTQQQAGQWAQIVGQIVEKLSGTSMSTTIRFDNLEIDVPKAKGPDGRELGGAKWVINGQIVWTTEARKKG